MEKIKIGLLGLGTVGGGTARIFAEHADKISAILGKELVIKTALVKDIAEVTNPIAENFTLTESFADILNDKEIQIVAELMGGVDYSYSCIKQALAAGKNVVTANKDLLAVHGAELSRLAEEKGLDLFYEAAVAGGIPILRSISTSFAGDNLSKVTGIMNGTTNFILTKMTEAGADYDSVLKEAQRLGFAEADPTADVEGIDAARKVIILTKFAFGMDIKLENMEIHGISNVQSTDISVAKRLGYTIKLLGLAELVDGKVHAEVGPMMIPNTHPLATVRNEMNAVYTTGHAGGEMMFYGAGAGELPTASAVVADIMETVKNIDSQTTGRPFTNYTQPTIWQDKDEIRTAGYFHFEMQDQPGVFVQLAMIFNEIGVSFDTIFQEPSSDELAETVVITHVMTYTQREQILQAVKKIDTMRVISYYNVMD